MENIHSSLLGSFPSRFRYANKHLGIHGIINFTMVFQHCSFACLEANCKSFSRYKSQPSTCTLHFQDTSDTCPVVQHGAMLFEKVQLSFNWGLTGSHLFSHLLEGISIYPLALWNNKHLAPWAGINLFYPENFIQKIQKRSSLVVYQ